MWTEFFHKLSAMTNKGCNNTVKRHRYSDRLGQAWKKKKKEKKHLRFNIHCLLTIVAAARSWMLLSSRKGLWRNYFGKFCNWCWTASMWVSCVGKCVLHAPLVLHVLFCSCQSKPWTLFEFVPLATTVLGCFYNNLCVKWCSTPGEMSPLDLHIHYVGFWSNADSSSHTYREELLLLKQDADRKAKKVQSQCQELQSVIQQVSEDFQKVSCKPSEVFYSEIPEFLCNVCISVTGFGVHLGGVPF